MVMPLTDLSEVRATAVTPTINTSHTATFRGQASGRLPVNDCLRFVGPVDRDQSTLAGAGFPIERPEGQFAIGGGFRGGNENTTHYRIENRGRRICIGPAKRTFLILILLLS